jgi:hypothetical protein
MMKQLVLVGILVGALGAGGAYAQTYAAPKTQPEKKPAAQSEAKKPATEAAPKAETQKKARPARRTAMANENGHTTPKPQPETAPTPSAPTGDMALGNVHLAKAVKADGKTLSAGTYQVRLTAQTASPDAKGQTKALERWVEFVQKGQVKGREVVTIVPQSEIDKVQKDAPPPANGSKVETLKGGDYVRLWINKGGNHYLVHFPA